MYKGMHFFKHTKAFGSDVPSLHSESAYNTTLTHYFVLIYTLVHKYIKGFKIEIEHVLILSDFIW